MIQTFPPPCGAGELRVVNPRWRVVTQMNAKAVDALNDNCEIDAIE